MEQITLLYMFKKKTAAKSEAAEEKAPALPQIIKIGELFRSSISDYKQNWRKYFWLLLWPVVLVFLLKIIFTVVDAYYQWIPEYISLPLVILAFAGMIYFSIMYVWAYIAAIRLTDDLSQKVDSASVWRWYHESRPYFWKVIAVGLVYIIFSVLLSLCFLIPGIMFMVAYAFSSYFIVYENSDFENAFGNSRVLVKGYWWAVFGRLVGGLCSVYAVYLLIGGIIEIIKAVLRLSFNFVWPEAVDDLINDIVSAIGIFVFNPLALIYVVKIFKSLKEVKKS